MLRADTCRLNRRDILDMADRLSDSLSRVLLFSGHAVYFPQEDLPSGAVWIAEEKTLLLPLFQETDNPEQPELLGVFTAREVENPGPDLLDQLPAIAALCLENLALHKASRLDPVSGLATRQIFEERVSREITAIMNAFSGGEASPAGGCLGIIALRLAPLRVTAREHGLAFAERLFRTLAQAASSVLPEGSLAARTGDTSLAIFLPAASRASCERAAAHVLEAMDRVRLAAPLTGKEIGLLTPPHAGYALYPQDMGGLAATSVVREQAQRLLQRAALAASTAARTGNDIHLLGYGRLLAEGGTILRPLPLSRLVVSLGRAVGASEGQRFEVRGKTEPGQAPLYKGEISLVRVLQDESEAEIICLGNPGSLPAPGDGLSLLPESNESLPGPDADSPRDRTTGLLRHGDFLARLSRAQHACSGFTLALVDVDDRGESEDPLSAVAARLKERFELADAGGSPFGGRYGHHSLILFHPDADPATLLADYEAEAAALSRELGCRVGTGLACWPFLHYRRDDMVDCARKALEYALLLPSPYVGLFDSLAINISADKRHCLGDLFGAIEEYKLALLADENNALAWNSLGVCMAALGRFAEARHYFEEALARTPDDAALAYNLGAVCLNLNDLDTADDYFRTCLRLAPDHLYAQIRLGQTAERRNDYESAKACYQSASELDDSGLPFRHMARLCLREGNAVMAREQLHQALQRNPHDAVALQLMAALYLDGGEDFSLAESLVRHSLRLYPERKNSLLTLARALELQGREAEAITVRLKAEEL